jgi:hypothetical protein
MNDPIRLTAEWTVTADRLAVTYRVSNDSARPVYVIDGSLRPGPAGVMTWSDHLKVDYRPPETAVLGSRLTPLKPRVHSIFPPATFAVRLMPGEQHVGTLAAPLPLVPEGMTSAPIPAAVVVAGKRIVRPFAGKPPELADRPIVCRAAIFEMGVIPHDESVCPRPARLADRDLFRLEEPAWSLQQSLTAEWRSCELPMLVSAAMLLKAR